MQHLPIVILCAVALVAQTGIAPRIEIGGARPDVLLILTVFFGLFAPVRMAVLIGWGLGFFADLLSVERVGLLSLSYGLSALTLVSIRDFLLGRGAFMQFLVTLVFAMLTQIAWIIYVQVMYGNALGLIRTSLLAALYTAALAPLACGLLGRIAAVFGLPHRGSRRGYAALSYTHV